MRQFLAVAVASACASFAQISGPIRNKISAGDLASAESILEVYEREKGRDAGYQEGLAWVLRGAVLLGAWQQAARYGEQLGRQVEEKLRAGAQPETDAALTAALGAWIEAHAQILAHGKNKKGAVQYLDAQLARFAKPIGLRSRIYKRRNLLALEGAPAPELSVEESLGPNAPTLGSLRGKPVMLFGWAQWCADCKAQAAALGNIRKRFEPRGVQFVTLTRFYEPDAASERAAIRKVWDETYQALAGLPILISSASMERYGVSSTPTFILIDASGKVVKYLPYRLTEAELENYVTRLLR